MPTTKILFMKKFILLILFITISKVNYSQNFDFELVEKLPNISFSFIDDYLINAYSFTKIREENEGLKRVYARYYNDDLDTTIIIEVLAAPKPIPREENGVKSFYRQPNFLKIILAQNYNIVLIKDKLLSRGFKYVGENDNGLIGFKKDEYLYLIGKNPNEAGATTILLYTK